jgi:hypothetical protein
MRMIYKKRKAALEAKGVPPTLKHIIFYRSALVNSVPLQTLVTSHSSVPESQGQDGLEMASQPLAASDSSGTEVVTFSRGQDGALAPPLDEVI